MASDRLWLGRRMVNTGQGRRRLNARAALRTVAIAGRAGERSDSPGRLLSDAATTASDGTAAAAAAASAPGGAPSEGDLAAASTGQQQTAFDPAAHAGGRPPARPAGRGRGRGRGTGAGRGRPPKCVQHAAPPNLLHLQSSASNWMWLPSLSMYSGGEELRWERCAYGGPEMTFWEKHEDEQAHGQYLFCWHCSVGIFWHRYAVYFSLLL